MADSLPTIWPADPHTLAKHRILSGYLKAWMPILAHGFGRMAHPPEVLFVDAFAGPGKYEKGEVGSPVIAIQAALDHAHQFPIPISLLFIEEDPERYKHLAQVVDGLKPRIAGSPNIHLLEPLLGDCDPHLRSMLDRYDADRRPFGPALIFLDQFGYSAVAMDLVGRIMKQRRCEVFSYLNWNRLFPYMTDRTKWPGISRAFGTDNWQAYLELPYKKREEAIRRLYVEQLRSAGNSKYVWHFAMCGDSDQLLYWLFFCTNNLRGVEEMKKAMGGVDEKGNFRFSDADSPDQLSFFSGATQEWLADHLHGKFFGQERTVGAVKEYVLTETPCYQFKTALQNLESAQRLLVVGAPPSRKKRDFSEDALRVKFVHGPAIQTSFL